VPSCRPHGRNPRTSDPTEPERGRQQRDVGDQPLAIERAQLSASDWMSAGVRG